MEAGRYAEARAGFLAALALAPDHFGALNDLGALLYRTDYRSAARLAYAEAVRLHPENAVGRINLANALLEAGETEAARTHFEAALRLAPGDADAHQGYANLLQSIDDLEGAERHRRLSYAHRSLVRQPVRGARAARRVLLLMSAVGGNVPTRHILEETIFDVTTALVEAAEADVELPPHDVVFNAVGDPDLTPQALDAAEAILARSSAPVINPPCRVRLTGRLENARRLGRLEGVRAPRMARIPREALLPEADAFGYPLLIRSPGHHTGRHFTLAKDPAEALAAAEALPGPDLLLIELLNARDADGRARKYRVMLINGAVLPLHLALSSHWKVHYFTTDMADRPEHREIERAFLESMREVVGATAMAALERIRDVMGLDYAGVDFGLSPTGELILFEANATMVVNPPPPGEIWDYRRRAADTIIDAARDLVRRHERRAPTAAGD